MSTSDTSLEPGSAANIHDVARLAGVSVSTVSRSFRNPGRLNDETRRRVDEVAKRLNYRPRTGGIAASEASSHLHAGNVIGFQFFSSAMEGPELNAFYAPMLAAAQAEADRLGLNMLLGTVSRSAVEAKIPRMISERLIGGLLLVGAPERLVLDAYIECVPHIVLLDNHDPTRKHTSVCSDGFRGAYEATEHLFALGHVDIGFLYHKGEASFDDRFHGFVSAHADAGRSFNPLHVLNLLPEHDAVGTVSTFISRKARPTAIVAANDNFACVIMEACRIMGIGVPGDLSVIGFDDDERSRQCIPPLTTVRVDKELMGRIAVRRLYSDMRRRDGDEVYAAEIRVGVDLVERASCAPAVGRV